MKSMTGVVVSNKMARTVVAEIERLYKHPLYQKAIKRTHRIKAHTDSTVNVGDVVLIVSIRPQSREKHYKVKTVIGQKGQVKTV